MVVQEAARGVQAQRLSRRNVENWASARLGQVPMNFSEDFADEITLEGVRLVNPFAEGCLAVMVGISQNGQSGLQCRLVLLSARYNAPDIELVAWP